VAGPGGDSLTRAITAHACRGDREVSGPAIEDVEPLLGGSHDALAPKFAGRRSARAGDDAARRRWILTGDAKRVGMQARSAVERRTWSVFAPADFGR